MPELVCLSRAHLCHGAAHWVFVLVVSSASTGAFSARRPDTAIGATISGSVGSAERLAVDRSDGLTWSLLETTSLQEEVKEHLLSVGGGAVPGPELWGQADAVCAAAGGRAPDDDSPRLSPEQLRQGIVNEGGAFRLRQLLVKLRRSNGTNGTNGINGINGTNVSQIAVPIRVAVVGGSVEQGYSLPPNTTVWEDWVMKWLQERFLGLPKPSVQFFSLQALHDMRSPLDWGGGTWADGLVGQTFDLVLIQDSVNFPLQSKRLHALGQKYPYVRDVAVMRTYNEQALRRLLSDVHDGSGGHPALLFVAWLHDAWRSDRDFAYGTWEDDSTSFMSNYYEVSMVSARDALLHSMLEPSASDHTLGPRFENKAVLTDGIHPTALGHQIFGQVVAYSLCRQFALLEGPLKDVGESSSRTPAQLPMALFADTAQQQEYRKMFAHSGFSSAKNEDGKLGEELLLNATPNVTQNFTTSAAHMYLMATAIPFALLEAGAAMTLSRAADNPTMLPNLQTHSDFLRTFSLEPLRFVGVAHIVLFHEMMSGSLSSWPVWCQHFASVGRYWVQFFFALSGYVLFVSQRGAADVQDQAVFFFRRISSAYPGYLVGCILGLLASDAPLQSAMAYLGGFGAYLPGFLMVDSWFYPFGRRSPNPVAWFLCTLCFFWFRFPQWYRLVRRIQRPVMAAVIAWLATFGLPLASAARCLFLTGDDANLGWGADFASFHPLGNWQAFCFGMCLGRLALEPWLYAFIPAAVRRTGATTALLVLSIAAIFAPSIPDGDIGAVLTNFVDKGPILLPLFGLLLILVPFGEDEMILQPAVLESGCCRWLGAMSAQLFILHWPTRLLLARATQPHVPGLLIVLAVQMGVAALFHEAHTRLFGRSRVPEALASKAGVPESVGIAWSGRGAGKLAPQWKAANDR